MDNDLLSAVRMDAPRGGSIRTASEGRIVDYKTTSFKEDPAYVNKAYRATHEANQPTCTMKIVTNSRIFGTRGSSGSSLAKSAIRLAIDTGVRTPSTFEVNSLRSLPRVKTVVINDVSANSAVLSLNDFEHRLGGQSTSQFKQKMHEYIQAKRDILAQAGIPTDEKGRPLFRDDSEQESYFKQMQALSFAFYEVYLSMQPKGLRVTRSKGFRALTLDAIREAIPEFTFEIQ